MEFTEPSRRGELANSSSFHHRVYSEIEEVGWDRLVNLTADLKSISFRVSDKKGRMHLLEIRLDYTYPRCTPSISADVPYIFVVEWPAKSRLKHLVQQFQQHLERLQEFWSMLDDIDNSLRIVGHKDPPRAISSREIDLGNDCIAMFSIHAKDPRALPECRFMGSDPIVNSCRMLWRRNSRRWMKDKMFIENLSSVLEIELPGPMDVQKNDHLAECGICYAHFLPIDDELGDRSGTGTDYICENTNCSRDFHSICLVEWLRSITTTRQSFNVLFGNCPYCSEPVAVKISNSK